VRKAQLIDCNPRWVNWTGREGDPVDAIHFDCPEGHVGCGITIPFTPALDGSSQPVKQRNGAQWERTGDTFETLTLSPSIRTIQRYASREAAIAAGCIPEYVTESMMCALHIFIQGGRIEFCGDSK
jgi:Family of unknown function (DUF6527)